MDKVISQSNFGSRLYGLEVPNHSDNDIYRLIEGLNKVNKQVVDTESGQDVKVVSLGSFLELVEEGSPIEIDVLCSKSFNPQGDYKHLIKALRFSPFKYIDKSERLAIAGCKSFSESEGDKRLKKLKVSARSMALAIRMREMRLSFVPEFNRDLFYKEINSLYKQIEEGELSEEKLLEALYEVFSDYKKFIG